MQNYLKSKNHYILGCRFLGLNLFFSNKIHTYRKYLKALRSVVICAFFYIINLITVYIVICTAFFALNAKLKILAKIIANTNEFSAAHPSLFHYNCLGIIMRKPPLCIYAKAKGHIIAGWYIRISSASLFSLNR